MSALSAIGKRLDELSSSIKGYRVCFVESQSHSEVSRSTFQKLANLVKDVDRDALSLQNNVKTDIDKLVLKLDYKDPVTGTLRYGETSKAKIVGFAQKVEELLPEFSQLQSDLHNHISKVEKSLGDTPPEPTVDATLSRLQAPVMGPIRNIDRYVEFPVGHTSTSSAEVKNLSSEDRELEEKARQVRERKAHEAEHIKNIQEQLHAQLETYVAYLNTIHDQQAKRVASKSQSCSLHDRISCLAQNVRLMLIAMSYLISFFTTVFFPNIFTKQEKKTLKEALKTTLGILERIISRPDDIAARRLRITHPVLKVCISRIVPLQCSQLFTSVFANS